MSLANQIESNQNSNHSLVDYEEMLIGAICGGVIDVSYLKDVRPDFFSQEYTRKIHQVIVKLVAESGWADYLSIIDELSKTKPHLEMRALVEKLIAKVPAEFNPQQCIEFIEENFIRRSSVDLINSARVAIQQNPTFAPEILFQAYEKSKSLLKKEVEFDIKKEFDSTIEDILEGSSDRIFIKTGLQAIDGVMGGLSLNEVSVIGARPGHGKTTIAVSLAKSVLEANPNITILLFSLEMAKEQIKRKFLSSVSEVSSLKIRLHDKNNPTLSEQEIESIKKAGELVHAYNERLFIFDDVYDLPTMNKIARQTGAKLVMVDFISWMEGVNTDKRNEIGAIAKTAKKFAKVHNMHYLFFSQLNRTVEARDNKRPEAGDLAESDQLTQACSEIILLKYPFKYTNDPVDFNSLYVITDKARHSQVGDKKIYVDMDKCIVTDNQANIARLKMLKGK